ncbi:MAG: serine/threonine protein kinase [Nannocystaceae bacterium]|nr:serine/threonine protein kinase [Nannocystaceae bacterium]
MGGGDREDANGSGLGSPPSTAPPPSVRAAILARVVQQSVGGGETPLLDGRYRLLREIGRGGAGTVWEAELLPLGRLVAVKLLRSGVGAHGNAVSRLMREAMTVSKLGHEHIVQVNDVGTDEHGSPYIAMELLQGESLAQLVARRGRLPWPEVAEIAMQLCDALCAAHAVGIVHRDVKPANVFVTPRDDRRWHCKLLDFGLCTGGRGTPTLTAAGVLLGTPGYAAPEQTRGDLVDGRADLYGVACVMVELLTGRPAFRGESRQEVLGRQLTGRRCGDLDTLGISGSIVALLDRGLSRSAQERHDDPAEFAKAIASVRGQGHQPSRDPDTAPRSPIRWGSVLGVATTLACASGLVMVPWSSDIKPVVSTPSAPRPVAALRVRVEPPPVAPDTLDMLEQRVPPEADVRAPPGPVVAPPAPPVRLKRGRHRASKAQPHAEPEPPVAQVRRAYADGIRDPFAVH